MLHHSDHQLINVARTLPRSSVNGPGERFVVWVQGCSLRCAGCWNPDTWNNAPNRLLSSTDLASVILATRGIEGLTLTGGEPFEQASSLLHLVKSLRENGLSIFVFTGYELKELISSAQVQLLRLCDVVVAGRYQHDNKTENLPWLGSSNQAVHFLTDRYNRSFLPTTQEFEVHLGNDGQLAITGFPPSEFNV